jgi:hypothetical protein
MARGYSFKMSRAQVEYLLELVEEDQELEADARVFTVEERALQASTKYRLQEVMRRAGWNT